MLLTLHEQERLLIHVAADIALKRRERGLRLNLPEATAVITAFVLEGARDGRSVVDLMESGRNVLESKDLMEGAEEMLREVQVETMFPDEMTRMRFSRGRPLGLHLRVLWMMGHGHCGS